VSCGCGGPPAECCCDVRVPQTPLVVGNRPGLPELRRRVATHATAKSTMLHALSRPQYPGTAELTSRTDEDFAVALLDGAASVVDLLTRYTERFVNEHYLRTATERRSVAELARLLGYQPQPGLAATADVAFTLDPAPGAPSQSLVPAGSGIQSSPDPGQTPVVYETLSEVLASPAWNAIRPRARVAQSPGGLSLSFAGTVDVAPGDGVLFRTGSGTAVAFGLVRSVTKVEEVLERPGLPGSPARTDLTLGVLANQVAGPPAAVLPAARVPGRVPASVAWLSGRTITADELDAELLRRSASLREADAAFAASDGTPAEALLFRQQRPLFGNQAPISTSIAAAVALDASTPSVPQAVKTWAAGLQPQTLPWENATVASLPTGASKDVDLEGAAPAVTVGSLMVLRDGDSWGGYQVTAASPVSLALFGVTGRATRVRLDSSTGLATFSVRRTIAYAAPERITLAEVPAPEALPMGPIVLDGLFLGLRRNRRVVVQGEPVDDRGHPITHTTSLAQVRHDFGAARATSITLAEQLPVALARSTTSIAANVVRTSQGETRPEVLGSGDSRVPFQRFELRQPPLTYLSAATPSGLESTLTVWVDGVRWSPVATFVGVGPDEHVYVTRETGAGTVVQFGNGITGARLPTGTANVTAVYRTGSGVAGRVRSGQLSVPTSRAGGVTRVANPGPSQGGDDPESVNSARVSAPLRVTTLDRIVSLADFALYARAFPGVAKAHAVWARAGDRRGVVMTVAGTHGMLLDPTAEIGGNLLQALQRFGDPLVAVKLVKHTPRSFRLAASVRTSANRVRDQVLDAVSARLRATFAYDARDLGQPVAASEVLAEIHAVTGVIAATITQLWKVTPGTVTASGPPPEVLTADAPRAGADIDRVEGAELIVIDPAPIAWTVLP
jgi:predicted phage baseplate assembly protein